MRNIASKACRHLTRQAREEAIAEVVADTTVGFAGLAARGRPHVWLIPALARYAVRRRSAGRRVGTPTNKNDLLSPVPRRAARVESLGADFADGSACWRDIVTDPRRTKPAEVACFAIDFERWLSELPVRQREIALALADGERPGELAQRLGLSPGRISQLRSELRAAWAAFQGDDAELYSTTSAA